MTCLAIYSLHQMTFGMSYMQLVICNKIIKTCVNEETVFRLQTFLVMNVSVKKYKNFKYIICADYSKDSSPTENAKS